MSEFETRDSKANATFEDSNEKERSNFKFNVDTIHATISADSEDQTIQSSTSSDMYGDILPSAWGSLDEAEALKNVSMI